VSDPNLENPEPEILIDYFTIPDRPSLYTAACLATVKLERGGYATLVEYRTRRFLVTAAHCCRSNKQTHDNGVKFAQFYQAEEPPPDPEFGPRSRFIGYGFLDKTDWPMVIQADQLTLNTTVDLAAVEVYQIPAETTPLEIAQKIPDPNEPALGLSSRPVNWHLPKEAGGQASGEILTPHNGYREVLEPENSVEQRYAMVGYPGDSGTPLINGVGQLIGITRTIKSLEISRNVIGLKTIRGFLDGLIAKSAGLDSRYA